MSGAAPVGYVLRVDGAEHRVEDAWPGESLLYVLRERLGLAAAKPACEQGECGSCSVLLDGVLVCACLVLAAALGDAEIATVEGLARGEQTEAAGAGSAGGLTDVQEAFVGAGAIQCGFCTPGLVMAVHDLVHRLPDADELTVREELAGNLCRCTGYGRVLEAVRTVARSRREVAT